MSGAIYGAKATAELLDRYGLHPDKSLGQHFLIDPNQIDRIVKLSGVTEGDHIFEVGPGLGALTAALLAVGANVTAVEIDTNLAGVLQDQFAGETTLKIINEDALKLDWAKAAESAPRWSMIANLPYNVGTPLILDLLDKAMWIDSFFVMVQKEVAQRFAAEPGTKDYGIPSVKVGYWGSAKMVATVAPTVFLPPPRVESALVHIKRTSKPWREDQPNQTVVDLTFKLVKSGFNQRRKMLRSSLKSLVTASEFELAEIEPTIRPDRLQASDWHRLAETVTQNRNS